ncbi:50S ribosomal protein L17 [bacterium]|nr:50S ribosomal protein L17 [bacterium]
MRHRNKVKKLGMRYDHRKATLLNQVRSLIIHERIRTTETRAKVTKSLAERIINFGIKGDLASRRHVLKMIPDKEVVHILFNEIGPRYKEISGGYLRILKLGFRKGDGAPMVLLELTHRKKEKLEAGKKGKKAIKETPAPEIKTATEQTPLPEEKIGTAPEETLEPEKVEPITESPVEVAENTAIEPEPLQKEISPEPEEVASSVEEEGEGPQKAENPTPEKTAPEQEEASVSEEQVDDETSEPDETSDSDAIQDEDKIAE